MRQLKIIGVEIFLERRKTRMHVGVLERIKNAFMFSYDEKYFRAENIIPLGPEFPLTARQFKSKTLFPTFEDRIPSRQNPAYVEYCHATGIDPQEKDELILLSMIGRRGPSSFVFYPIFSRSVSVEEVVRFRESLGLTTREFAKVFELSQSAYSAVETGRLSGKDLLKRLEIIYKFPDVAAYLLYVNGGALQSEKLQHAFDVLKNAS